MKQSAINEREMMEWYDKHHAQHFAKGRAASKSVIIRKLPSDIHYGEQNSKGQIVCKTYNINGHTITLWDDGLLTCNCLGWVMKRVGRERECTHCREIYSQLTTQPKPDKNKPIMKEAKKDKDWKLYQEFLTFQKMMKGE